MLMFILFFTHLFFHLVTSGIRPIVPLYADLLGASIIEIGLLISVYSFFSMILAIRIGKWMDKYGGLKMVFYGGTGLSISLIIPILYPHLAILFFTQLLMGISQIALQIAIQKTIGNLPGNRDKHIANLSFFSSLGSFSGPLIGGFSYQYLGFQYTLTVLFGFAILGMVISLVIGRKFWRGLEKDVSYEKKNMDPSWMLLKNVNLRKALFISGIVLSAKELFISYFPLYGTSIGLTPGTIGLIISISAAMALVVRFLQYRLVRLFGRGPLLFISIMISGIAYASVPFFEKTFAAANEIVHKIANNIPIIILLILIFFR